MHRLPLQRGRSTAAVALLGLLGAVGLVAASAPEASAKTAGTAGTVFSQSKPGLPLTGQVAGSTRHATLATAGSARAPRTAAATAVTTVTTKGTRSTWTVNYGDGFSGNQAAQDAFGRAVSTWSGLVTSAVPIVVNADLSAFSDPAQLGGAGPADFYRSSSSDWYPVALANSLAGSDLAKTTEDIDADFSSNTGLFYYGTDPTGIQSAQCKADGTGAATTGACYDFQSIVLHELGHGLGFIGSADEVNGLGQYGYSASDATPFVFDDFVETSDHTSVLDYPNKSKELAAVLQSGDLFWDGAYGAAADRGREPRLYAPNTFEEGSTYSHLSEESYPTADNALTGDPDALMTPQIRNAEIARSTGQVLLGMFQDMGWVTPTLTGSAFTPVTPVRVLDTGSTKVGNKQTRDVVIAGKFGVPADATAVVVNVTGSLPQSSTYVIAYPVGRSSNTPAPLSTSNVDVDKGQSRANLATVPLGTGGAIRLMNVGGAARLIADLAGYYAPESTSLYNPIAPVRLMDTRYGTGVRRGRVGSGGVVTLPVTGANGVPADATAVTLTLTAVNPNTSTYVQSYPTGAQPATSSVNLTKGKVVANQVVVKVGTNGTVSFRNNSGTTDLIADLAGWYGTESGGAQFRPTEPQRLLDTGYGAARLSSGAVRDLVVSDTEDTDEPHGVPAVATAAALNLTGAAPSAATYLTVYPPASTIPKVSNLDLAKAETGAASATVRLAADKIRIYNNAGTIRTIVDVQGWFGPASS